MRKQNRAEHYRSTNSTHVRVQAQAKHKLTCTSPSLHVKNTICWASARLRCSSSNPAMGPFLPIYSLLPTGNQSCTLNTSNTHGLEKLVYDRSEFFNFRFLKDFYISHLTRNLWALRAPLLAGGPTGRLLALRACLTSHFHDNVNWSVEFTWYRIIFMINNQIRFVDDREEEESRILGVG